jgi:hypothetical protein
MAAFLVLPFGDFGLDALSSFPAHGHGRLSGVVVEYLQTSAKAFAQDVGVTMSDLGRTSARCCCAAHHPCIVRASQSGDLCVGSHLPGGIPNVIGKRLWRR